MAERIVAIGLLTERDLSLLGPTFDRAWPVEEVPCFTDLVRAIDEADEALKREGPLQEQMAGPRNPVRG